MVTPGPRVLAIVPARGGSKSIPRKNLRAFAGRPLLAYSVAAGVEARTVTRTLVSTDDEEIAVAARAWGAEAPFLRPALLAEDTTPDLPLFVHALDWLEANEGWVPDVIVQLRPTSPLRPRGLVDAAVELLLADQSADSVRAVTAPNQNPFKMWRRADDGALMPLLAVDGVAEPYNAARQTLPDVWWQTGHVDVFRRDTVRLKRSLTGSRILPIEVPRAVVADIDTETDWAIAEGLLQHATIDLVVPRRVDPVLPSTIAAVVLDFDGVLTDDRVWTDQDGRESVASSRSDGYGVERLRAAGVPVLVLSRETNAVVAARCRKLGIECVQAVLDKGPALRGLLEARGWAAADTVYVGNDITDLDCLALAGCGVAVADAHPAVRAAARLVLSRPGGRGAVRELSDMILQRHERTLP